MLSDPVGSGSRPEKGGQSEGGVQYETKINLFINLTTL